MTLPIARLLHAGFSFMFLIGFLVAFFPGRILMEVIIDFRGKRLWEDLLAVEDVWRARGKGSCFLIICLDKA